MEFGAKAIYEGSTAMERRGKKQDGAEGEAEMHCRLDKISVNLPSPGELGSGPVLH